VTEADTDKQDLGANATDPQDAQDTQDPWYYLRLYGIIYGVLFVAYIIYSLTAWRAVDPVSDYLETTFPNHTTGKLEDLEKVFVNEKGQVTLWERLVFTAPDGIKFDIEAGTTLSKKQILALGQTIIADLAKKKEDKQIGKFLINRFPIDFKTIMTVYNIFGLFLLGYTFLKSPLLGFLDSGAKEVRSEIQKAREAREHAETIKERYEALIAQIEVEKAERAERAERDGKVERQRILEDARREAKEIVKHVQTGIEATIYHEIENLRRSIAREALAYAKDLASKDLSEADHEAALDAFVADCHATAGKEDA
jgi:F-type H+-transporting ATPase subunit b